MHTNLCFQWQIKCIFEILFQKPENFRLRLCEKFKAMPRVLRIINRLNLGGPTYNAAYLSKYLEPEFETLLVAGMKDDSEASSEFITESLGLKPVYISNMHRAINPFEDRKAYLQIKKIIEEFKPDIVHTHAAKSGALGRLAAHNCGVPVILHTFHGHVFHSYFNPIKTAVFLSIERYLAKKSSKIIAISNLQKKELCQDFKIDIEDKFSVIPLGFDLERFQLNNSEKRKIFREKYGLKENDVAIGIVGRIVPVKNHQFFLQAFSEAKKKTNVAIKAIIIGDGELREQTEKFAKDLGLNISRETIEGVDVLFTSWIKEIDKALPGLDIVALTSLNEGTPVSLIEAQAAGVPIVSTRVGGIEDIVIENTTALLSNSNDVGAFSKNIQQLAESKTMREKFSDNGNAHVAEKFSYKRLADDMRNLYRELLTDSSQTF
jgi:glycosyltransferase involved in cell wall biosynthesis